MEHGIQEREVDLVALGLARVVVGDEAGEFLVSGVQGLDRLDIGLVRFGEGGAGLGDLGLFLGLVRRLLAEEHRQVAALDQELGQMDQGLAGLGELRMGLDERFELFACFFQEVFAQDQVARLGGLVDQGAAFLIIEDLLDLRRRAGSARSTSRYSSASSCSPRSLSSSTNARAVRASSPAWALVGETFSPINNPAQKTHIDLAGRDIVISYAEAADRPAYVPVLA